MDGVWSERERGVGAHPADGPWQHGLLRGMRCVLGSVAVPQGRADSWLLSALLAHPWGTEPSL